MTYDPYRNDVPRDPYRDPRDPKEKGAGAGLLLGALLLAALGGFIYFFNAGDQNVATNEVRPPITQPSTTGSSSNMTPAPAQPIMPDPKAKPVE